MTQKTIPAVPDFVDTLGLSNQPSRHIDYMQVKVLSEVTEHLRHQVQQRLIHLRSWRGKHAEFLTRSQYIGIEEDILKQDLREMYTIYRSAQRDYFDLYRRAMKQHLVSY